MKSLLEDRKRAVEAEMLEGVGPFPAVEHYHNGRLGFYAVELPLPQLYLLPHVRRDHVCGRVYN